MRNFCSTFFALGLAVGLAAVTAGGASAAEKSVITEETSVARAETKTLKLPTLPGKDKPVYLTITSRLEAKELSGSNFMMRLAINGKNLGVMKDAEVSRMKDRALSSPITPKLTGAWYGAAGWRVLYAPDFEAGRKAKYYEGDPYTTVLDITDLIQPGAENQLEVTNTVAENVLKATGTEGRLFLGKVSVSDEYTASVPAAAPVTAPAPATPAAAPSTPAVKSATGTANSAEGISVLREPATIARNAPRAFEFGTVPQEDTTVLMEITSRLDAKELSGSSFFLKMMLNGQEVQAAKTRTANRLKNRAFESPVTPTIAGFWYGSPLGWRVVYAPDFLAAHKQKFYEGDPYTIVLDVTDLVNPAAENRLEITNTANERSAQAAGTNADLVIQKITIRTVPGKSPMMANGATARQFINTGQRAGGPAKYAGRVLPGGGFSMTVGNREWKFSSAFSYPNAGLNQLAAANAVDKTGQATWQVRTTGGPQGGEVTANAADYSIRRVVRFTPRKVEITDAITNTTRAPLGLLVRDEMSLNGVKDPVVRLAGNSDPSCNNYFSPGNPSVHVTAPGHTIAMLCEDDVFRNQARLYTREAPAAGTPGTDSFAGLRTEMLRIGAGETYTLRWSVYPVASPDYFDFINLVRQDWGANITAEGGWYWGYVPDQILQMTPEEIKEKFTRYGVRYAIVGGGWVDRAHDIKRIGFGAGVMDDYWADYRRRIKESAVKIRAAVPGCKVLVYFDTQRDTTEGGHERFADSWLTDAQGTHLSTEWNGVYSLTYSNLATVDNSFGKATLDAADRYMDEMGLDGIYWDEMENVAFGSPLLTYNKTDGHSCTLDPKTYTIKQEVGNTVLLGEGHRLAVIDRIRKKGGVVMGNGYTGTKALLGAKVQRMTEIQHNDYWAYEGLFQTPLGYMGSRMDFGNITRALQFGYLPVGTRISYSYDIARHFFPFTPIELHSGYLLGRERIITLHNGNYGWDGPFRYRLWTYGADGKVQNENPAWVNGTNRVAVQVPQGGVVIMERAATKTAA